MQHIEGCTPGRRADVKTVVTDADTAVAMGSGDVAVLSTPRVLALAEQAAVKAIESCLDADKTSVGAWVELEHLAPTPVGAPVVAEAVLLGVHGRRLEFAITVRSDGTDIATVRHRRVVASRARFESTPPAPGAP